MTLNDFQGAYVFFHKHIKEMQTTICQVLLHTLQIYVCEYDDRGALLLIT